MSLRLVRCPFCGKRFNVAGIAAGTRLRCGWCTAVLTVPRSDAPAPTRRLRGLALLTVGGGIAAGLAAAAGLYFFLRPSAPAADPVVQESARPAASKAGSALEAPPKALIGHVDDAYEKAQGEVYKDFGTQFIFFRELAPFLIGLERSPLYVARMQVEEFARRLELLDGAFQREFGDRLGLPRPEGPLTVVILSSRESYDRFMKSHSDQGMPSSIKGIYDPEFRRIVMYHDHTVPYEVILHEGAHQLVHYHTRRKVGDRKVPCTYWFQEGLGTYFEGFRPGKGGSIENDETTKGGRLALLKHTLLESGKRDFISLSVLAGMTVDEFWDWLYKARRDNPAEVSRKAQLYYAESWALVHFLRHRDGNTQKVLDEYFKAEISGQGSKETFERLCREHLGREIAQLEDEFITYIVNLR